jgi:hypothetical protein
MLMNAGTVPLIGWKSIWQLIVMAVGGGIAAPMFFKLFARVQNALSYQPRLDVPFRADREIKRRRTTLNS